MWKMNVKKIFSYIGAFFVGIGSAILYFFLRYRRTDGNTSNDIREAEQSNQRVEQSIDRCTESVADSRRTITEVREGIDTIQDGVGKLESSIEESRKIFEEIKNQRLD